MSIKLTGTRVTCKHLSYGQLRNVYVFIYVSICLYIHTSSSNKTQSVTLCIVQTHKHTPARGCPYSIRWGDPVLEERGYTGGSSPSGASLSLRHHRHLPRLLPRHSAPASPRSPADTPEVQVIKGFNLYVSSCRIIIRIKEVIAIMSRTNYTC